MIEEILQTYSDNKVSVDRENRKLLGCIVMSTDVNYNRDFIFSETNQEELVALGNSFTNQDKDKCYSYLGHSRGSVSDDRLPFRIGYWENFRLDGSLVRADLCLDPIIDVDPILQARFPNISMSEYVFQLAETKPNECGFSMVVFIAGSESEPVIKVLSSIDLVESPALTLSLFSQKQKEILIMDTSATQTEPVSKLSKALELFNNLDAALIAGEPVEELVNGLIDEIKSVTASTSADAPSTENFSKEPSEIDSIKTEIQNLKTMIEGLTSNFSKKEEVKTFSVNVIAPVSDDDIPREFSKEEHKKEYHRLRKENLTEAATYFRKNLM